MNPELEELAEFLGIDQKDLVGPPGKDGYTPIKGVDYFDGDDGENYVLTPKDKKEIASLIDVPVVEKIIEKTEVIKEQPIVTEHIIENTDTGEDIRNKLELLKGEDRLDASAIKNLPESKTIYSGGGVSGVREIIAGTNITVDNTNLGYPVISATGGGTGSPGGSNTEVQFNDGGSFGGDAHFTFNKTTDTLHVHAIAGDATDGLLIEADNGTDIGRLGAANTANVTWYGNHNYDAQTADTIAGFGATKTLGSLSTATYPSLTELSYVKGVTSAIQAQLNAKAPSLGADDNYVTDAEKVVIGNTSGTNTGDQTSIVGITGTKAQFDTAVTDGNFLYVGDITQYTDEMAQDAVGNAVGGGLDYDDASGSIFVDETELVATNLIGFEEGAQDAVGSMVDTTLVYTDATPLLSRAALTGAITASAGSNTTALGSFTKAELDAAVSDGNPLYVGDVTQYTDEMAQDAIGNVVGNGLDYDDTTGAISVDETELAAASIGGFTEAAQDAVGAMVDTSLTYVDGTPLLQRAALTGAITASAGSNTTALGSFTLSQLNTAVSDANIIPEAGGTFTGDVVVPDEAYGSSWDGSLEVPTKNAIYDIISILGGVAITRTIVTTTGDVTMGADTAVDYVYVRNSDHVLTFPTAVGNTNRYTIKNRHSSPCTPRTDGTETIDGRSQVNGASTNALVIFPNEAYDFLSDGSNWYTI